MRTFIFVIASAMLGGVAAADAAAVDVLSGDVIRVETKEWRIANIDAPSIYSPCPPVRRLGREAQAKLAEIVNQGELEIKPVGSRDEGKHWMAYVLVNGADVGEQMIADGVAQRHGEARELCAARRAGGDVGIVEGQGGVGGRR